MKRDRAIDYEKGVIVLLMVWDHVLAYFGNSGAHPEQSAIMMAICSMAFSTFVFAYGRSVFLAYYSRDFKTAAPRMLGSAARSYLAFCISGIANNVLCQGKDFSRNVVKKVVLLKDIPSMSEFLVAFAILAVVALALYVPMKKLLEHRRAFCTAAALLLLSTFIPYDQIMNVRLGLLIGSKRFYLFPVLQYFPLFMAGLYVGKYGMNKKLAWFGLATALTSVSTIYTAVHGQPERFPPTLLWIIMPSLGIVLLDRLAQQLSRWTDAKPWAAKLMSPVENMGRNSLYYLVTSNLLLFAMVNMNQMSSYGVSVMPLYRESAAFPFSLETGSTPWSLFWTLVMLVGIGFVGGLYRKAKKN